MQLICGEDIFDHLLPELFSELPVQEPPTEEPAVADELKIDKVDSRPPSSNNSESFAKLS